MRQSDGDEDELPVGFTRSQMRDILEIIDDHKRRKWLRRFIGKVATWVALTATAIEAIQTLVGKYLAR